MIGLYARDAVTLLRGGGFDAHNSPLTPTSEAVVARVVWGERKVIDQNGETVLASALVMMGSKPSAGQDQITIDGTTRRVISVREKKGFGRTMYYEVAVQ